MEADQQENVYNARQSLVDIIVSRKSDTEEAMQELADNICARSTSFVLLFLPEHVEVQALPSALVRCLGNITVFGCSTAGQITLRGYENNAFLALVFPKNHFRVASSLITPLSPFSLTNISQQVERTERNFPRTANWNRLALLIIDGLSKQEDLLIAALTSCLPDVPVFGGSAGDGQRFQEPLILHNGELHKNAALLLMLTTDWDYDMVSFDHFVPTTKKMVVTDALPDERIVFEINGAPAAEEYARIIGKDVDSLSPHVFAQNPLLIQNKKSYHVRAIQRATEKGGLVFFCAIDVGLILTLGYGKEMIKTLDTKLSLCDKNGQKPSFILAFDCFLRRLEVEHLNKVHEASQVFRNHRVVGFNTYGEQHHGMHVNQTFVGVAFYPPDLETLE